MKRSIHRLLVGLPLGMLLLPATVLAHPGHMQVTPGSGLLAGFIHPLTGIDHILALLAVGLWAAQLGGRSLRVVPGAFLALMLVGAGIGMAGISLPYVQAGILASVLVSGVLLAGAFRLPASLGAILVGSFALFHGNAHGSEMPLAVNAFGYVLGFTLASAVLLAGGVYAGSLLQRLKIGHISRLAGGAIVVGGLFLAVA